MEVEPQREVVGAGLDAVGGARQRVLAVDAGAVAGDHQHAPVHHAELRHIAVMRGRQQRAVADRFAFDVDNRGSAGDRRALQQPLHRRQLDELARRGAMIGQCRMRRRAACEHPPVVATGAGHAAIGDDPAGAGGYLEGKASGVGVMTCRRRRRRAGVHDDGQLAGLDALEPGVGHARHRIAVGIVIGQQGRDQVARRVAHAVEQRKAAVAVAEEPQHRHHAVDGVEQGRRRCDVAGREGLPQRQQIEQQFDQRAGIARDVPAVGQDLALQLVGQLSRGGANLLALVGKTERGITQRDQHLEPRQAVGDVDHGVAQITDFAGQRAQVAAVELAVGVGQHQRGLRQQRDDAAGQHVGAPAHLAGAALIAEPVFDQRAGIGAGQGGIRRAQMPQPAEAEQRRLPVLRRRLEVEDRAAVRGDDLAGEHEAAGIDFSGAGGVGGAQVLRRDEQPIGPGWKQA